MAILFYILFVFSALLLILIILLQEGKGGGLSDAFGGAGTETFGVRSGGINKFTFGLFALFILSALAIHWTSERDPNRGNLFEEQPNIGAPAGGAGAGGPGGPPPAPGGGM